MRDYNNTTCKYAVVHNRKIINSQLRTTQDSAPNNGLFLFLDTSMGQYRQNTYTKKEE